MSVVNLIIANKSYPIGCQAGDEAHLADLGRQIDIRAREILDKLGAMHENQMLATLCVVLMDEIGGANDADLEQILARIKEIKRKML